MPLCRSLIVKRKRFQQRPLQRDPVRGRVHFVFRQLQLSRAHVFMREKLDFLEATTCERTKTSPWNEASLAPVATQHAAPHLERPDRSLPLPARAPGV